MSHTKIKLVDSTLLHYLIFNVFWKICQRLFKQTRKDQTKVKECIKSTFKLILQIETYKKLQKRR